MLLSRQSSTALHSLAPARLALRVAFGAASRRSLRLGFVFTASAVEKRKPLAATARRAGWVGCNIVLRNIPNDAKIGVVIDGAAVTPAKVRQQFARLRLLKELSVKERGWMLDVLRVVQSLGKQEFKTSDMYEYVRHFEQLHPDNRHVRDKIRQQLQVLRDRDFLRQHERGVWAVRSR